jgi:hypothetical protein
MREEFEALALNLNKNFNVEIQHWNLPGADQGNSIDFVLDDVVVEPVQPSGPAHIEDMPRIMQQIVELWPNGKVTQFIHELLRDNRGGARQGFSLSVVEELLFLIELRETMASMDRAAGRSA